MTSTPFEYPHDVLHAIEQVQAYEARFMQGIQLYAGSSTLSPLVERWLSNGMGLMPAMGPSHQKQQPGTDEISELELLSSKQLIELFGGQWAEPRLQSCTYANAAVYAAFSKPGDAIASISAQEGGHVSHHEQGTVGLLDRRNVSLVFKHGIYDDRASADVIARTRPKVVMLGASVMLDPYELDHTIQAARECHALLVYDASHVAGLIAGNAYQNPMDMGFDIMTASTYKSLAGPPGGILVGRDPEHHRILGQHIVGGWASNYDASRLAGLSIAFAEALIFMPQYARAMINNAGWLSSDLRKEGIETIVSARDGNTQPSSHQIIIVTQSPEHALSLSRRAEQAGIYIGTARVPGRPEAGGLRIGTQVITRRGAGRQHVNDIAACFRKLLDGESLASVKDHVQSIASGLQACLYSFPLK